MSAQLSKRSSLILLAALALALAFGLLAAGPWIIRPDTVQQADQREIWGLPAGLNVLSSLPLCLAGLWGLVACVLQGGCSACEPAVRRPMALFFALAAMSGAVGVAYHLQPGTAAFVAGQSLNASVSGLLTLAFLAERVHARAGSWVACGVVLMAGALGGLAWWAGHGDVRLLAWLQALPVLLLSAGMAVLPGRFSRSGDWIATVLLYIGARLADMADGAVLQLGGLVSGHTLMHLGVAGAVGWMAWRVWATQRAAALAAQADRPSLSSTSFHTAG